MAKLTIAIDIDDVLSLTAKGFSEYSNKRWGASTRPEDYTEELTVFWNIPLDEARSRIKEFVNSDAVYYFEHFKESLPVLNELRTRYDLVLVTSRRVELKEHTSRWLERHFQGMFSAVHYAGIWDDSKNPYEELKRTKAELCRQLGAEYLIDDQPKHCIAAQEAGVQALLFGDYRWSNKDKLPSGVVRVKSWQEVKEYFDAQG